MCEMLSWVILGDPGVAAQPGLLMPPIHPGFITRLVFENGCASYFVVYDCVIFECTHTVCKELTEMYKVLMARSSFSHSQDVLIFILL